jgi:hypothetical protein
VAQNLRLHRSESLARLAGEMAHPINHRPTTGPCYQDLIALSSDPGELRELARAASHAADRAVEIGRFLLTCFWQSAGERASTDILAVCRQVLDESRTCSTTRATRSAAGRARCACPSVWSTA